MNDVKEAGIINGEDVSPGRCPTEQQDEPSHHHTTAKGGRRRKWSPEVNRIVIECITVATQKYWVERERMHMIWKEKGMFNLKEQRLLDQKYQIVTKKWFSDLELNKIKEKSVGVVGSG